jgi:D-glycero-D-manno-heptose 1,7-bisphosphate phosphatase
MSSPEMRKAVFLDRDGVINVDYDYVHRIEDFDLIPGAVEGMLALQRAGYALVVVTNQAGIARGVYTEAQYLALSRHMEVQLQDVGVVLAGIYHCPHHPDFGDRVVCDCRKPKAGMLLRAGSELGLDISGSVLVGDKATDIGAGRAAGVKYCLLVRSGQPVTPDACEAADDCVDDLAAAARWVIERD